jgi:hypothetical protein
MKRRAFQSWLELDPDEMRFALGIDRQNKTTVSLACGPQCADVALITPPAVTLWPRVTGDGNYGTMWGPADITKAKFNLDLTDHDINDQSNADFSTFMEKMNAIDDKLLDFVFQNQLKVLGRKNLSKEEVKMLQIRTVRPKYDKISGNLTGHTINLTTSKYAWDGMGGKYARKINVCDHQGAVVPNGVVCPGDVVAATVFANQVYTGVGGDKFGIHWSFEDVSVVCQRAKLDHKTSVSAFGAQSFSFAAPYTDFSEPQLVTVGDGGQFQD